MSVRESFHFLCDDTILSWVSMYKWILESRNDWCWESNGTRQLEIKNTLVCKWLSTIPTFSGQQRLIAMSSKKRLKIIVNPDVVDVNTSFKKLKHPQKRKKQQPTGNQRNNNCPTPRQLPHWRQNVCERSVITLKKFQRNPGKGYGQGFVQSSVNHALHHLLHIRKQGWGEKVGSRFSCRGCQGGETFPTCLSVPCIYNGFFAWLRCSVFSIKR